MAIQGKGKTAPPAKSAPANKGPAQSKAVVPTKTKASTAVALAVTMDENDVGAGKGNADKDSYAIPFLTVVQKMSPYVDENDPKFIEGAKAGMFINTVTMELYDGKEGVTVLPCAFQRRFIKWGPRGGEGSGFKGEMLPDDAVQLRNEGSVEEVDGRLYFPNGKDGVSKPDKCDYLSDTRNHFCLLIDPETGAPTQVLVSLASTMIKKSKRLMTLLDNVKVEGKRGKVTPPTWVNQVLLTTTAESNDKGSWSGIEVALNGFIEDQELYTLGKQFHDMVSAGQANVNYEQAAPMTGDADEDRDGKY